MLSLDCTEAAADFITADQVRFLWFAIVSNAGPYKSPGDNKYYVLPKNGTLYFSSLKQSCLDSYLCKIRSKWTLLNSLIIRRSFSLIDLNVRNEGENLIFLTQIISNGILVSKLK